MGNARELKRQAIVEVGRILDGKCNRCELVKGMDSAEEKRYCETECDVYLEIKRLRFHLEPPEMTKEKYIFLRDQGLNNKKIAEQFGVGVASVYRQLNRWNLSSEKRRAR